MILLFCAEYKWCSNNEMSGARSLSLSAAYKSLALFTTWTLKVQESSFELCVTSTTQIDPTWPRDNEEIDDVIVKPQQIEHDTMFHRPEKVIVAMRDFSIFFKLNDSIVSLYIMPCLTLTWSMMLTENFLMSNLSSNENRKSTWQNWWMGGREIEGNLKFQLYI